EKVNPDSIDQTIMKIFNSNVAWKYRFMVFSYTILAKHQTNGENVYTNKDANYINIINYDNFFYNEI
ncbi:MAG: hypothetical protein LBP59_18040, partial [Planctomycetaceae bacterium]|nr:hypothetical protein [Planctomycetaceae bacterium]